MGLLSRADWCCDRIAAPWAPGSSGPIPEQLFRRQFRIPEPIDHARLYITSQGLYEAELNGRRVGDYFLAPGWTAYDNRLQYQTYDVTHMIQGDENCLGVRAAEGWFCGRIGFEGGHRQIWGPHPCRDGPARSHVREWTRWKPSVPIARGCRRRGAHPTRRNLRRREVRCYSGNSGMVVPYQQWNNEHCHLEAGSSPDPSA